MNTNRTIALTLLGLSILTTQLSTCFAQGSILTYQGRLDIGGAPANGSYDFEFRLIDAANAGTQQGSTITVSDMSVSNGLFSVALDFGGAPWNGGPRWLEIAIRPGESMEAYTNLAPRQPITSAPYAIMAAQAMTVDMGTISNPGFLGTTSTNAPLDLLVNSQRAFRLQYPSQGTIPNLIAGYAGNSIGLGSEGAVILGGGTIGATNSVGNSSAFSFIGSGQRNQIASNSFGAAVVGGQNNLIENGSAWSAIGGGVDNGVATGPSPPPWPEAAPIGSGLTRITVRLAAAWPTTSRATPPAPQSREVS